MVPIIDRGPLPDRTGKDGKHSSKGLTLAVILIIILMLSGIAGLIVQMGNNNEPHQSKSEATDYNMLNGDQFSGSGGTVFSSPPYVYLGSNPTGGIYPDGKDGWASYYFTINPAPPTYALTVAVYYTDTYGNGPSIYAYNHATLFWDLVASNIGKGTNLLKSYPISTNYITSTGGVNVKIYSTTHVAKIMWVEVVWSYTSDTTPPTCTITSPTSNPTYSTSSQYLNLGGTASDNVGVTSVTWYNAATGFSGTASGTTSWSIGGLFLNSGIYSVNVITITAHDAAGNTGSDTITVTLDVTAPGCTITTPTSNPTYSTSSSTVSLGGSASDDFGVTSVTWHNAATGASGTASGTTSWSTTSISLVSGSNVITVTAYDAAGNAGTDTITVTYTPQQIPEFGMMPLVVIALMAVIVLAGETRRKKGL